MDRQSSGKKIFFLMVACIFGIGMVGYAAYATKNTDTNTPSSAGISVEEKKSAEVLSLAIKESSEKDDDNDSLLNWEEALWGTDPKKADSDGDGTNDGEEVKLGRNPLVAGPNDALESVKGATNATANVSDASGKKVPLTDADKTETARISQELFTNYLNAKQTGATIDESIQDKIINQTFSNESLSSSYRKYTRGDIKVSVATSDTEADLRKYGNDLGSAFYAGLVTSAPNEMEVVHAALTGKKPTDLKKLDPIIASHKRILTALAVTTVPSNMINTHLNILNTMSRILANTEGFKVIFTDPLISVTAIRNYYKDLQSLQSVLSQLVSTFDENEVFFSETEKAYLLVKNI